MPLLFDYLTLKIIWWLFVCVLLVGFALLDGFDLGVGTLLPFLARTDEQRRVLLNAIGPTWEGNQVWFITAGGAMFAAWPFVYATAFSGFYWAMLLVLFALFFRPVGFEYRSKVADPRWRNAWDWGLFVGGAVPALVFGVAFGNLLQGVPFELDGFMRSTYTGSFWGLLNPFGLLAGVVSLSMLVMHYTGMVDGASAIRRLTSSNAGVSAHYVVNEDGTVLRLVDERKRAWHAGVSYWRGITDVNSASIGIEIVNPGHEFGYRPFPGDQVAAVVRLTDEIRKRHDIPRANVVGHSDVAPSRKQDPGELFPWDKLARLGHALAVPENATVDPGWTDSAFLVALERFGYDIEDKLAVVVAFQRRFRPALIDGTIDGQSRAILFRLLLDREQGEAR